jgi:ubiquitin-activating enzyme E1
LAGEDLTEEEKTRLNRQIYAFGYEAQSKISKASVLLIGLKGLGVEIAKNVILAGVGSFGVCDDGKAELGDLGSQFFLTPDDIGQPRAAASVQKLAELNKYCRVHAVAESDLEQELKNYNLVCVTGATVAEQVRLNELCRATGVKFISGDICGVMAAAFIDFGVEHIVTDVDGEREKKALIVSVTQDQKGVVTCHEDNRHNLSDGDWVTFLEVEGMTELNESDPRQVRVVSPFVFTIEDTTGYSAYTGQGGYFIQVKVPQRFSFQSLQSSLDSKAPVIVADYGLSLGLHCLYLALSNFRTENGHLPRPDSVADNDQMFALATAVAEEYKTQLDEVRTRKLARCACASISPMAAFLGGILGQEVLKGCSGKFTPIQQHFYFDAEQVLSDDIKIDFKEYAPVGTRYDHQIAVIGQTLHTKLQSLNYFLIGAGAIGCEMLKNWALMGVATGTGGQITVTDMDVIETSNLSRQFLFREADVQQLKSSSAARAVLRINSTMNITTAAHRVGPEREDVYDDVFWEGLDAAVTALDNVQARVYVDKKCVFHGKPMIDSGTLGTKGNTQCVIPYMCEPYGSSRDPPEEGIPVCTLKNFPNKIEHTIAWARDRFEGSFANTPQEALNYLTKDDYLTELAKQPNTEKTNIETVLDCLVNNKPANFTDCVAWARLQFQNDYSNTIRQLLAVYPEDKKDPETGARFWSGQKRAPTSLTFDADDDVCMNYIVAAANLRAFNFGIEKCVDREVIRVALAGVEIPEFQPSSDVKIAANDEELKKMQQEAAHADDHDEQVRKLTTQLPDRKIAQELKLTPVEFEKDDDTNFHMDFITACSNLRARNYKIKEESKHQTKFIAGKIIPAIATTTAMVTGLVCLELYKTLYGDKKVEDYRNSYANLAVCVFAFSEPFPPEYTTVQLGDGKEWKYSSWDRVDMKGPLTLQQFMDHFETQYGLTLDTLTYQNHILVSSFSNPKKLAKLKKKDMMKVLTKSMGDEFVSPELSVFLIFEGVGLSANGEAVVLPTIRYQFR